MRLDELPEELIDSILDLLDFTPPSLAPNVQLPSRQLIVSNDIHLKSLSQVSKGFRRLTFNRLFSHVRFNASILADILLPDDAYSGVASDLDIAPPVDYDPTTLLDQTLAKFEAFTRQEGMPVPKSLLLYSIFETEREDRWHGAMLFKHFWQRLLGGRWGQIVVTIVAPPMALARLCQLSVETRDIWAFDMPYQRVQLRSQGWHALRKHGEGPLDIQGSWHHLAYDEGSSLNLYGHYHYQDKLPPSILHLASRSMRFLAARIRSLTYTAVFPHYDSFRKFLKLLPMCECLEELSLKLAPEGDSPLLSDDERVGHGGTSFRDCWNELERCYFSADLSITKHMMDYMHSPISSGPTLPLRSVNFLDCQIPSIEADFARVWNTDAPQWVALTTFWQRTALGRYRLTSDAPSVEHLR